MRQINLELEKKSDGIDKFKGNKVKNFTEDNKKKEGMNKIEFLRWGCKCTG